MPAEEVTAAIVLRVRDYSESDRIVTLLTREAGKLSGIAKGAKASRRRFEQRLEPFSHVMLHFRRRPHGRLVFITRAEAADLARYRIDDDLGKIALGSYMVELTNALTSEEQEASGAYETLAAALAELSRLGAVAALRQAFELRMLRWAGFGLDFGRCRICSQETQRLEGPVWFVAARGGVVCERCRPRLLDGGLKMETVSAAVMNELSTRPIAEAAKTGAAGRDGALAISRFIASMLDRRLRSIAFLDSVMPPEGKA